jgi:acetyl-CoA acyltransferase
MAAYEVIQEGADAAIGGGVESISLVQRDVNPHPVLLEKVPGLYMEMGVTAEVVAKRYHISREAQDEYALSSQQRTARAQREGFLAAEIAPMNVTMAILDKKTGEKTGTQEVCCDHDECNRPDTTLEGLLSLKPYFDPTSGRGSVTAGNSSQLSDGASATLVMSRERADALRIPYTLVFRGFAVAACEPDEMGIAPVFAIPKLLNRYGLQISDIDLWELNEAFAVQVIYCRDRLGIPMDKLNVNGGSISIGHPFGMTGSRMTGALANEMARRPDSRYGVVTMCVGGGKAPPGCSKQFTKAAGAANRHARRPASQKNVLPPCCIAIARAARGSIRATQYADLG